VYHSAGNRTTVPRQTGAGFAARGGARIAVLANAFPEK
jgi:hypothetical protein